MSVPHALLALLTQGPMYGLQLQQAFEWATGEVWPINVGQVYATLQRLERDGLVETDGHGTGSRQKGFQITSAGQEELSRWLRTPPALTPPPRDELVIKVLVALRVPGVDIHELLQIHRKNVVSMMQRHTHLKAEAQDSDVAFALVVDSELFRLDSVVRWLDATDARLRAHAGDGPIGLEINP